MKYLERFSTSVCKFAIGQIVYHVNGYLKKHDDKFEVYDMTELGRYIQLKNLRTNKINPSFVDNRDYLSEEKHEEAEMKRSANKYNV